MCALTWQYTFAARQRCSDTEEWLVVLDAPASEREQPLDLLTVLAAVQRVALGEGH